jgi:hypothetical protein
LWEWHGSCCNATEQPLFWKSSADCFPIFSMCHHNHRGLLNKFRSTIRFPQFLHAICGLWIAVSLAFSIPLLFPTQTRSNNQRAYIHSLWASVSLQTFVFFQIFLVLIAGFVPPPPHLLRLWFEEWWWRSLLPRRACVVRGFPH